MKLTQQQQKIYDFIVKENLSDVEIQKKLCITPSTLKAHKREIYFKFGVTGLQSRATLIFNYYNPTIYNNL